MRAVSLLWSIKQFETCLDTLHAQSRLVGREQTIWQSQYARSMLAHLGQLLDVSQFQTLTVPWNQSDGDMRTVLATMYEAESADTAVLGQQLTSGELERLERRGQIDLVGDVVVVPLEQPVGARNWPPLLRFLLDKTRMLSERVTALVDKLCADGAAKSRHERHLIASLRDRLSVFRTVLREAISSFQLLCRAVRIDDSINRLISDIFPSLLTREQKHHA